MKLIKSEKPIFKNPEYLLINNWFTPEEEQRVWKELEFYTKTDSMERAENKQDTAKTESGDAKARSYRMYLDNFYHPDKRHVSDILKYSQEGLLKQTFHQGVKDKSPLYSRMFTNSNRHVTMLSYYEQSDYYDVHYDAFHWTQLIWFFKEPKKFKGGDFLLTDFKVQFECTHNTMLMFPSYYEHAVRPVELKEEDTNKGFGRYTITNFIMYERPKE